MFAASAVETDHDIEQMHAIREKMDALQEAMDMMSAERAPLQKALRAQRLEGKAPTYDAYSHRIDQLKAYALCLDDMDQALLKEAEERWGMDRFLEVTA